MMTGASAPSLVPLVAPDEPAMAKGRLMRYTNGVCLGRYTLKIARTDRTWVQHEFSDLSACFATLDMLRSFGVVRRAWVKDAGSCGVHIYSR